jgi:putative endonuclease
MLIKSANKFQFYPTVSIPFSSRDSSSGLSQTIGTLGEQLVQAWLNQQGWEILSHQYRCRWGEIDLIARKTADSKPESTVIFVEVKTRKKRNWDEDGLLAITATKQAKLIKSAQTFLSDRPQLADFPCRFDVALVRCDRLTVDNSSQDSRSITPESSFPTALGQPVQWKGYQLILQSYIQSAFEDER